MENKRSFTVLSVSTNAGSKGKANAGGRYISSSPAGAALKAGNQVCKASAIRGQCTLYVKLQETTQGSSGKVYEYKIKRAVVNKKVNHDGKVIVHKYTSTAKSMN